MRNCKEEQLKSQVKEDTWSVMEQTAREGACRMLQTALEAEVEEFINKHQNIVDSSGHRKVVKNGYMPERKIYTGIGPISIRQPRVDERRIREKPEDKKFSSAILPRFQRRFPSVDNLIPVLYLKGISTGDFSEALSSILGGRAQGLSAANISRLKAGWEKDYKKWSGRDLSSKEYVYFWADGIYFNVRLDSERTCILMIMGADTNGNKELVAVSDGYRESAQSWREILLDLKRRGLKGGAKLATGDGALGFWKALREVYPDTRHQRCWVHKTANILDKMSKGVRAKAKAMIHDMYMSETRKQALNSYEHFIKVFKNKYPKATECLEKDKEELFAFYDFPAAHWEHIRSTNAIESTFATVRLRTNRTRGCGSRTTVFTMVFKLVLECQKRWHKLKGYKMIVHLLEGKKFVDGLLEEAA